jgi:molybdate transport system ATP-binding protein
LNADLRAIIGPEAVGAIVEGTMLGPDSSSGLTRIRVGRGELKVEPLQAAVGAKLRVQLLARDLIVATSAPRDLSVRNVIEGVITQIAADSGGSDLISIDIGGAIIMARITRAATRELSLLPGRPVWALVKSVSLRGHVSGLLHARP